MNGQFMVYIKNYEEPKRAEEADFKFNFKR